MKALFQAHLKQRLEKLDTILEKYQIDTLFIDAGDISFYFQDDIALPFRPSPHFLHYCPSINPASLLTLKRGQGPHLTYVSPEDFWHKWLSPEEEFWADSFDIELVPSAEKAWSALNSKGNHVILSPQPEKVQSLNFTTPISQELLGELNWGRICKTQYEVECIRRANQKAAQGHLAARNSFFNGGSEFEIHMEFMKALECSEANLPYPDIVALDQNAAVLHHGSKEFKKNGSVALIDAGARYNGYCSDITRTYTKTHVHSVFKHLLQAVEVFQQKLCNQAQVNLPYGDLHLQAHRFVGESLLDVGILKGQNLEELIHSGLTQPFFPHGLGHPIGLQTHDVAGKDKAPNQPAPDVPGHPFLRSLRSIQDGDVLTIEPGIYFIPMLLEKFRGDSRIHWDLVNEMLPLGGIRIEDEIHITSSGVENLTRPFLGGVSQ